jgi:hypothetical protein
MDRISMKKFKFHTTTDVFMQCKIRACAAQPCGTCQTARRGLSSADLSPVEGEMFAPPTKIRVSAFDKNALVFAPTTFDAPATATSSQPLAAGASTAAKIEIASDLTLPLSVTWATENRAAVEGSLRSTLNLSQVETLRIVSITAGRRQLQQAGRGAEKAKIDFVVGVSSPQRAESASFSLNALSAGSPVVVEAFTRQLDESLVALGKPAVSLDPKAVKFAPAQVEQRTNNANSSTTPTMMMSSAATTYSNTSPNQQTTAASTFGQRTDESAGASGTPGVARTAAPATSRSSTNFVTLLLVAVIAAGVGYLVGRGRNKRQTETHDPASANPNSYVSKIASHGVDSDWTASGAPVTH